MDARKGVFRAGQGLVVADEPALLVEGAGLVLAGDDAELAQVLEEGVVGVRLGHVVAAFPITTAREEEKKSGKHVYSSSYAKLMFTVTSPT